MTTKKTASPRPKGIYYIAGDELAFETAVKALTEIGKIETGDGASLYTKKETTRGESVRVLEVPLSVIRGMRSWNRRGKETSALVFTAYQLLDNNLLRQLNEKTLKDEAPVKKARKMIENLPQRSALAARR